MTIRPSPDPTSSKRSLELARISVNTFFNWLFVAGTNGKQYFRNAGITNGIHIMLRPIAAPPVHKVNKMSTFFYSKFNWTAMLNIPDKAIKIFPPVDSFLFVGFKFCEPKLFSHSLGTDVILRLELFITLVCYCLSKSQIYDSCFNWFNLKNKWTKLRQICWWNQIIMLRTNRKIQFECHKRAKNLENFQ